MTEQKQPDHDVTAILKIIDELNTLKDVDTIRNIVRIEIVRQEEQVVGRTRNRELHAIPDKSVGSQKGALLRTRIPLVRNRIDTTRVGATTLAREERIGVRIEMVI